MRGINTYGCAVCIWGNKYPRSGGRTASQCSFVGGQIGPQATQLGPDNRPWGSDQTPLNCIFPPWKRGPGLWVCSERESNRTAFLLLTLCSLVDLPSTLHLVRNSQHRCTQNKWTVYQFQRPVSCQEQSRNLAPCSEDLSDWSRLEYIPHPPQRKTHSPVSHKTIESMSYLFGCSVKILLKKSSRCSARAATTIMLKNWKVRYLRRSILHLRIHYPPRPALFLFYRFFLFSE